MPKGAGSLAEENEKNPVGSMEPGSFIQRVLLPDNQDFAEIRFITEYDQMFWDYAHRYQMSVGNAGKKIWRVDACKRNLDPPQECAHCAAAASKGEDADRRRYFWYWVHVFAIYYSQPGDGREQVQLGTLTKFRYTFNRPFVLERPATNHAVIETMINTYGGLLDRNFKWVRQGARGDQKTTYNIVPLDPSDRPEFDYLDKLPAVEEVAYGSARKIDLGEEPETVKVSSGEGTKSEEAKTPAPSEVPEAGSASEIPEKGELTKEEDLAF